MGRLFTLFIRQLKAMNKWDEENNVTNAIELVDKANGTNTNRDKLQLMLQVLDKGDLVVIKSIDRLSRNYKECKQLWEEITGKEAMETMNLKRTTFYKLVKEYECN